MYNYTMTPTPSISSFLDAEKAQPADVLALLADAKRLSTPCGEGEIVWHVWGLESAPSGRRPLVLLHGGSGSWTHWLRNIGALAAAGHRIYVPDLPGFGDSARPPEGNDADALPVPIAHGLQLLLGREACDLVGFSFGGMVAGLIAEQFAERVARLVLVGAPGLGIQPKLPVQLRGWRHLANVADREAMHRANLLALMLHAPASITPTALRLHIANVVRDRMRARSLSRTDILARALPQLACPVFAIYGVEDVLYRGQLAGLEAVLQKAPAFRGLTLIESAGHWVQFERAAVFNEVLLGLLESRPAN